MVKCLSHRALIRVAAVLTISFCLAGAGVIAPRIVGGQTVAQPNTGIVSLQVWRDGILYHFCGATLISPHWLLTAAHCVNAESQDANRDGIEDYPLEIFYSGVNLSDSGDYSRRAKISRVLIHPNFNASRLNDDIALLYVAEPIDSLITTLGTGSLTQFSIGNSLFEAQGWGADNQAGNHYPNQLKSVFLPYQPCPYGYISDSVFCAGGEALQDTCFGDSGGPVLAETSAGRQQFGIVSFGAADACGLAGLPAAFTFVPDYLSWINAQRQGLLFSNAPIFSASQLVQKVAIYNPTNEALTISQIVQQGCTALSLDNQACLGQVLAPAQSCDLTLTLTGSPNDVHQVNLSAYADDGSVAQLAFSVAINADNSIAEKQTSSSGGGAINLIWLSLLILLGFYRRSV
ncbi:serine protease [Motilimonas cestriensis]|uniref:Serine protease n=1 Tax=Motilimonas cestriensis TaxID=2742685 RepID=A0ABS8W6E4_9GAMM|nr:serine protease [Motilimonas cestriensis]MCE2594564.1 serine protease [Motilimonas cestriensis]